MFYLAIREKVSCLLWTFAWSRFNPSKKLRDWSTDVWTAQQRRKVAWAARLVNTSGWKGMVCEIDGKKMVLKLEPKEIWDERRRDS